MDTDARFVNAHRQLQQHLNRDCDRPTCLAYSYWLDRQNEQGIYPTARQTYEWALEHAPHALEETGRAESFAELPQRLPALEGVRASYMKINFSESRPAEAFNPELPDLLDSARSCHGQTMTMIETCQRRVGRNDGGRELALAKTKLQEVGYWLAQAAEVTAQK